MAGLIKVFLLGNFPFFAVMPIILIDFYSLDKKNGAFFFFFFFLIWNARLMSLTTTCQNSSSSSCLSVNAYYKSLVLQQYGQEIVNHLFSFVLLYVTAKF